MDDNTLRLLDFGDNVFAQVGGQNTMLSPAIGFGRLAISGSDGALDLIPGRGLEITSRSALAGTLGFANGTFVAGSGAPGRTSDRPGVVGPHVTIQEPHVYADLLHLVDCLREDREPLVTGEHARHVIEIIEPGYLAARTGQTQQLTTTF
jgi:predicted dehydrogenase